MMCRSIYNSGSCLKEAPCVPSCSGKNCGNDGCGGSCGQCDTFDRCVSGVCSPCLPDCHKKSCGDDSCGNPNGCGSCPTGQTCISQLGSCRDPTESLQVSEEERLTRSQQLNDFITRNENVEDFQRFDGILRWLKVLMPQLRRVSINHPLLPY